MQLTRIDRWLLEEFVHETHIHTLSPSPVIPKGIREIAVPDTPGRRYKHHYVASNGKAANALIAALKENSQMFATQVIDRKAWYVRFIAPRGKSVTWRCFWAVVISLNAVVATHYLTQFWNNDQFRKNLAQAIETLKG